MEAWRKLWPLFTLGAALLIIGLAIAGAESKHLAACNADIFGQLPKCDSQMGGLRLGRILFWLGVALLILAVIIGVVMNLGSRGANPGPGWYSDPWGQAPFRWFDGAVWTGHVSDHRTGSQRE